MSACDACSTHMSHMLYGGGRLQVATRGRVFLVDLLTLTRTPGRGHRGHGTAAASASAMEEGVVEELGGLMRVLFTGGGLYNALVG